MSPSIVCLPQPGKPKSRLLLEAFAAGAGGEVAGPTERLPDAQIAFFGIVQLEKQFAAARARGGYWYGDNSYWDVSRGRLFRFSLNALQATGREAPDWPRYRALGLAVEPWRRDGRHIVVVEQSPHFMREVAGWSTWLDDVLAKLKAHTDRTVVVRRWSSNKAGLGKTLHQDLDDCWALVTHASAASNEALLFGVPVFVTGQCAALAMGLSQLEQIESPRRPDGRETWAAALAGRQWTIEELRSGEAWQRLTDTAG